MYLVLLLPLLFAQSCTLMLWRSLPEDLKDEDHSFVVTSELTAFAPAKGPQERYRATLKLSPEDAHRIPGALGKGRLVFEGEKTPGLFFQFLQNPPPGWRLHSFGIRLESWWRGLSEILSTDGTLTLRGTMPRKAYAHILPSKDVPDWLRKDPPLAWPEGPGARPLQDAIRRFEGDTPPPGFIGRGTPYWDPIGFVGEDGKRVSVQAVLQALATAKKGGGVLPQTPFRLQGRIQKGMEPLFKEVPLSFLLISRELSVDPLPQAQGFRWTWIKKCHVRADGDPSVLVGLPKGLDHIPVSWMHHRSARASFFWPVTIRVVMTPVTLALDIATGFFFLWAKSLDNENDQDPYHYRHHH